ncbi:restriction endonuclease subunit S [uncultured Corynebacterium sp.]|uniref:restriction endonuclease subunit S n=1 Tax=uncultured Corynebacterium sp. TaxID=159447 RepID=UPI002889D9B2|nr:restriction endonuclease subunit S [uncultured Corynebacterium sp.]
MESTAKHDWPMVSLLETADDVTRGHKKVPKSAYEEVGSTPIVDQSMDFICGYTDEVPTLVSPPYIVFGDHTRELKYIDFPFVPGADGVKVLKPAEGIAPKFLYFYLKAHPVQELGYSRHFKLLKELAIPLPPLDEQRRIAAILDEVEAAISAAKSQLSELSAIPFWMGDRKFELVALSELVDIRSSQVDPTSEPYMSMPHIAPNNLSSGSDEIVGVKSAAEDGVTSGKYAFQAGDILYSKIRPYLNKVSVAAYDGVCSADMYALVPKNKAQTDWIVWQLRSSRFLAYAASSSGRASIPKINRKALRAFKVQLVEPAVLEQFNREQNVKKALANSVRAKLHLLQELQSSLSTRAFQGEL